MNIYLFITVISKRYTGIDRYQNILPRRTNQNGFRYEIDSLGLLENWKLNCNLHFEYMLYGGWHIWKLEWFKPKQRVNSTNNPIWVWIYFAKSCLGRIDKDKIRETFERELTREILQIQLAQTNQEDSLLLWIPNYSG